MGTAPTGWQTPKTTWVAADAPLPADLNRIEGNTNATELGSRTLDQALAAPANVGTLRQMLSWIVGRIRAITGTANWFDPPASTIAAIWAKFHATTGHAHTGAADDGPIFGLSAIPTIPVSKLHTATGSVTSSVLFNVHQYAFASPLAQNYSSNTDTAFCAMGSYSGLNTAHRAWAARLPGGSAFAVVVTWDYLTSSGQPCIWALINAVGEIMEMWEAEDPVNPEFPEELPFYWDGNVPPGCMVIPLQLPKPAQISDIVNNVIQGRVPAWQSRSIYRNVAPGTALHKAMFEQYLNDRGLEIPDDIRDVYGLSDEHRRNWYLQLWLRSANRFLHNDYPRGDTMIDVYRRFRADKKNGSLIL